DFTEAEKHKLYFAEDEKVKSSGINMTYNGLVPRLKGSLLAKDPESLQKSLRAYVDRAVNFVQCPECEGARLAEHARTSLINGKSIADISGIELGDVLVWLRGVIDKRVAPLIDVLASSLETAIDLGLGYLTLARPSGTLSGGEAQRARMVRHLGSALTD